VTETEIEIEIVVTTEIAIETETGRVDEKETAKKTMILEPADLQHPPIQTTEKKKKPP
jgi:hypothetical protein